MPVGFDLHKYAANYNPIAGGPFVSIQDVMASWGDVFARIIDLLPQLVTLLEGMTVEDIIKLLEVGLTAFVDMIFPPDGSVSPLITGLVDVLGNVATSGDIWTQIVSLAITLGPQVFTGMQSAINGGTAASLLSALITLAATVLTSNSALLQGFTTAAPVLQQLISAGGGSGNTLADFGNLFSALASMAVTSITGLASGILPWLQGAGALPGTTSLGASQLSGLASGLTSWLTGGGALPGATSLGANQLTGLASGLATWLTGGGALPGGVTLPGSQLTGSVAAALISGVLNPANIPALALSAITGLPGYLTNLTPGGVLSLAGLASGALPSGVTAGASQLTGLATGIGTWLTSGGALPSATTILGSALTSAIGLANVPALPTSKITSGTFLSSFFPMFSLKQAAGSNLVLDPSFENASAWVGGAPAGNTISTDQAHSGTHSMKLTGTGSPVALYLNSNDTGVAQIPIAPGDKYRIGAWVYLPATNTTSSTELINLLMNVQKADGTFLSNVTASYHTNGMTTGQWNYIEMVGTAPALASKFSPMVYVSPSVSGNVYYVDDALVREETAPQNIIQQLFGGTSVLTSIVQSAVPALTGSWGKTIDGSLLNNAITNATLGLARLTGLATGIGTWLGSGGALPAGTTAALSQLTGLATGIATWLGSGGALPAASTLGVSGLTGLAAGIATWLASGGALPSGASAALSQITGLATGIGTWLGSGGALPTGATLGAGGLTDLASGIGSWLTGGGSLPSATTLGAGQLSGLATGIGSWLTGGGALPAGVTATISQIASLPGYLTNLTTGGLFDASKLSNINNIPLLPANVFQSGQQFAQALIPSLTSGWGGSIINSVVTGVQTWADIGSALSALGDHLGQSLGLSGSGLNFSDVGNALNSLRAQSNSTTTTTNANSQTIANRAVTMPAKVGIDPTASATFDAWNPPFGNTPTYLNITQSATVGGYIDITDAATKKAVWWYGGTTANITDMRIHLYTVDPTNGTRTWFWSSANIIGVVTNTIGWNSTNIASANYINAGQGLKVFAEMSIAGTGTYQLLGIGGHYLALHPTAKVPQLGGTRGAVAPTFFSTGTGYTYSGSSGSQQLAISTYSPCVVVGVTCNGSAFSASATCGGVAMNQVGIWRTANWGDIITLQIFALIPPVSQWGTTQTVAISAGASNPNMSAVCYNNSMGVGSAQTFGSTAGTVTIGSATAVEFGVMTGQNAPSNFNGNTRVNATGHTYPHIAGDLAPSTSAAFSYTDTGTGASIISAWCPILGMPAVPAPATVANPTVNQTVPFLQLSGTAGPTHIAPQRTDFNSSGTFGVPTTATAGDLVDLAGVGAGGSGAAPSAFSPHDGGGPGTWGVQTLVVGTDINPGATVTVSIPGQSLGSTDTVGGYSGAPGGNTVFSWSDPLGNPRSFTCPGGQGGAGAIGPGGFTAGGTYGIGPGNYSPNTGAGQSYSGGGNQTVYSQPGMYPGGGGAAGGAYTSGGNGASGYGACVYYR